MADKKNAMPSGKGSKDNELDLNKVKAKDLRNNGRAMRGVKMKVENGPEIRKRLIANKIYIPKLWPMDYHRDEIELEYKLADNILPIPCDQRYTEEDMLYICSILKACLIR